MAASSAVSPLSSSPSAAAAVSSSSLYSSNFILKWAASEYIRTQGFCNFRPQPPPILRGHSLNQWAVCHFPSFNSASCSTQRSRIAFIVACHSDFSVHMKKVVVRSHWGKRKLMLHKHGGVFAIGRHGWEFGLPELESLPCSGVSGCAPCWCASSTSFPSSAVGGAAGRGRKSSWRIGAVAAGVEWTPSLSYEQVVQLQAQEEESLLFRNGPPPGDLAEVEAYCRIHRLAELLHTAVMNSLRTLTTARAAISDDGDIPVLEEKVVAGLARMGAVLQQGRLEILGGRHIVNTNSGEALPPLARIRAELKDSCVAFQKALETCIYPSLIPENIHRPLQQLHNICLDAGFPRLPGSPSHADIPNLSAVKLQPFRSTLNLDQEEGIAFWRGGQLTEAGVEWLLKEGFKTIVDMRAEQAGSPFAQSLLEATEKAQKIRIIRMPVQFRTAPTAEQVKEFAEIVADPENKPLYLHSQGGVGRACAMVSRWREYVLQRGIDEKLNLGAPLSSTSPTSLRKGDISDTGGAAVSSSSIDENNSVDRCQKSSDDIDMRSKDTVSENIQIDSADDGDPGPRHDHTSGKGHSLPSPTSARLDGEGSGRDEGNNQEGILRITDNSFEAQRPGPNIFSKSTMSQFMKRRKTIPQEAGAKTGLTTLATTTARKDRIDVIAGPAGRWGPNGPGIPWAHRRFETQEMRDWNQGDDTEAEELKHGDIGNGSIDRTTSERGQQENGSSSREESAKNGALFKVDSADAEDNAPVVEGDMCASTTGVVRVQSRKKAEMYLVRTDGFSCTRERVKESTLAFTHPSTQQQMLMWKTAPKTVLLLKKLGNELMDEAQQVASFLYHQEGMNVIVEPDVHDVFARIPGFGFVQTLYSQDIGELHERVDFVICLGGDGVILHASNLFREAVPPVISFNLGSLGFLTAHPFETFKPDVRDIIHGNSRIDGVYITLRMRLRCELFRNGKPIPGKVFDVLNEVVVDRGSNPYLCKIECYERSRLITKVQADGVIVATPTGSTAYSTAAGGSMVHPNVPCMLFTPICPHSLSFRPVVLPDSALLELKVPAEARSNAWVSFDGKKRQQLCKGESIRIRMSEHPMPTVNKHDQTDDWFGSLSRCFGWNQRIEQRSISFKE